MGDQKNNLDKDYCDIFNNLNKKMGIDPDVCYRCNYELRKNNPQYINMPKSKKFEEYEKQKQQEQLLLQGLSTSDSPQASYYALFTLLIMLFAIDIFFWFAAIKATDYNIDNNENEKMYPDIKSIGIALYVLNSITLILFVPLCYYIYKAYKNILDTTYLMGFLIFLLLFYCVKIVLVTIDQRIIKIFD
jgi:hypothetical protein